MILSLIAAVAENGVIGRGDTLPWRLSSDLKRFKKLTMAKPIIMGMNTWRSIGRPLPGRQNIVLTRNQEFSAEGVSVAHSVDEAIATAGDAAEVVVIGGAGIYNEFLPRCTRFYYTRVEASPEGDVFFPEWDPSEWHRLIFQSCPPGEKDEYPTTYQVLQRKG